MDGRRFAADAIERGAVAVLAADGPLADAEPPPRRVPWLVGDEPRALAGAIAGRVHGHPDREMAMVAVTGTNGKSTVATVMGAVTEAAGLPTAIFGTLGYKFHDEKIKADHTTPEAAEILRMLERWHDQGARAATLEASSHALALDRLAGLSLDVAIWTNLTREHLDYHRTMEGYFQAKRRIFELLKDDGTAVVNLDDESGRRLAEELPAEYQGTARQVITYGSAGTLADVSPAEGFELREMGMEGEIDTPRGRIHVTSGLVGRFNLENVLATIAAAEALELPQDDVVRALADRRPIPGRLDPVDAGQPFPVLVDYAHSPGALQSVLESVREISDRKIVLIFGAGGDRDQGKREPMGEIGGRLSDLPIITSDNPRGEDPLEIISMVEKGMKTTGNTAYRIVPDRREAIRRAIAVATPEHLVLITGKGHEEIQHIGGDKLPFSDHEEVRKAVEDRFGSA
jgi:UDP-N-acetylmuramoyl-L-alanyl-D-glutamate--2,6-diaminopimelate ligase